MRNKKKYIFWAVIIGLIFFLLPTGTPDDIPETILLVGLFGIRGYAFLAAIGILLLLFALHKGKRITR